MHIYVNIFCAIYLIFGMLKMRGLNFDHFINLNCRTLILYNLVRNYYRAASAYNKTQGGAYMIDRRYTADLDEILSHRYDNGTDGGWRCNKFMFGHGSETEFSNPLPTLNVLDAFRFSQYLNQEAALDRAVDFLLEHWTIRKPIGPCHYGIGTLFMQVEYPFRSYNIFYYVYVLSSYKRARDDQRFSEIFAVLQAKVCDGQIIVERNVPKLAKLSFCKRGVPSTLATQRYQEILANMIL